jgi:hypothetical protein
MTKKGQHITAVWQNGGFSAKFNGNTSIELLCKTEQLCFDFRHFAKLQNVVRNLTKTKLLNEFTRYKSYSSHKR